MSFYVTLMLYMNLCNTIKTGLDRPVPLTFSVTGLIASLFGF